MTSPLDKTYREPRWPVACALLAIGAAYAVLPRSVSFAPWWALLALVVLLEAPALIAHHRGAAIWSWRLGLSANAVVTAFLISAVVMLVSGAVTHSREAIDLLRSGTLLWLANVLTFASWYWRLDAGGPLERERVPGHQRGAFLFPQMTLEPHQIPGHRPHLPHATHHGHAGDKAKNHPWSPAFMDYLFLAFNTSTAFSPTDVPVLSRWAKGMTMIQSLMSLVIVAVLIGRAVNAL